MVATFSEEKIEGSNIFTDNVTERQLLTRPEIVLSAFVFSYTTTVQV